MAMTRRPRRDSVRLSTAEIVVLPTPPLPEIPTRMA
jgi:hypothetical protein